MTGLREHFLRKYFGYRRQYVEHIAREAPHRARLAVFSELTRLAFEIAGNGLCAVIFWALTFGAAARGAGLWPWPLVFGALASVPTVFGCMSVFGFAAGLGDLGRVQERSAAATKAQRP